MMSLLHAFAYCAVAIWLLTSVGNWACRQLLALSGFADAIAASTPGDHPAGRTIGNLERLILAAAIIAHSWELVAAVIALKTVARFKELDERLPAEYFLVGSLFSLLWALLVTMAWSLYDASFGIALGAAIQASVAEG